MCDPQRWFQFTEWSIFLKGGSMSVLGLTVEFWFTCHTIMYDS